MQSRKPIQYALGSATLLMLLLAVWPTLNGPAPVQELSTPPEKTRSVQKTPLLRKERTLDDRLAAVFSAPTEAPELEYLFEDYPSCRVDGARAMSQGWVRSSDGLDLPFFMVSHNKGSLMALDSGSGTLVLEGFEETEISWTLGEAGLWCSEIDLVSTGGPWAVTGHVQTHEGLPVDDAQIYGCANSARTDIGDFFMTIPSRSPCRLRIIGHDSGTSVEIIPSDQDQDLGVITLPEEVATFGLRLWITTSLLRRDPELSYYHLAEPPAGTPAANAGLREGDRITHIDGVQIRGQHPDQLLLVEVGARRQLTLKDGRELTLTAVPLSLFADQLSSEDGVADREGGTIY